MTLDEAIKYSLNVAETNECATCGDEHRQLAEWLRELKQLREMLEKISKSTCWLALSHDMGCHLKDYAKQVIERVGE